MMFPAAQRPPHQNMIAQQSGYLGYYHGSQHQTQYQTPEYNFQHEGLNNGAWPNHPLYMPTAHSTHAMYPQRAATGYDEWSFMNSAAMHQTASSEASSPGLIPPMSSSSTSSTLQPPLTPSPCAMSNVNTGDQETSPYYRNYCSRTTPNYHETDTILEDTSDSIDIPPPDITIEPKGTRQNMPPYQWMKKSQTIAQNGNTDESYLEMEANSKGSLDEDCDETSSCQWKVGKTRTKDKYRVVYNDHQRMELEKEFISNHYITIRLKSDLAERLGLSQRQVKIWFQNRRAKDRKQIKKLGTPTQRERPENGIPHLPGSSFQIVPQHHSSHSALSGGQPQTLHQAFHTHHMQSQLHRPSHPLMDLKPYAMDMEMKPYPPFEHIDIKPPLSMQHHLKPSMTVDMKPSSMSVDMKPSSMSIDMKPSLSIMN